MGNKFLRRDEGGAATPAGASDSRRGGMKIHIILAGESGAK